jgi:hypothetical protein
MPWIDDYYKWGEFEEERKKIADYIQVLHLKDRLIIISGDAHMVAVDNGTHAQGGVKVFHAAALDAKPTTKGGPYSHGAWPGRNQFGTMEVKDIGSTICFTFRGWRWFPEQKEGLPPFQLLVLFDTCRQEVNQPKLYQPSNYAVQRIWKFIKRYLEWFKIGRVFVTYVDSSTVTSASYEKPFILFCAVSVLMVILKIIDVLIERNRRRDRQAARAKQKNA